MSTTIQNVKTVCSTVDYINISLFAWVCLQACQTHTVCCIVDSSLASAAIVTNHFTGHWRQAAAHFEAAWSLLSDSFSVLQDSLDLCKWWHRRQSVLSIVDGRWGFSVRVMLGWEELRCPGICEVFTLNQCRGEMKKDFFLSFWFKKKKKRSQL